MATFSQINLGLSRRKGRLHWYRGHHLPEVSEARHSRSCIIVYRPHPTTELEKSCELNPVRHFHNYCFVLSALPGCNEELFNERGLKNSLHCGWARRKAGACTPPTTPTTSTFPASLMVAVTDPATADAKKTHNNR